MQRLAVRCFAAASIAKVGFRAFPSLAWGLCAVFLFAVAAPQATHGQLAPGPYEILPFDDGCIIEAFKDLDFSSGNMADWTGWSGTAGSLFLISSHPYDGHIGTDFSVQTGTALHAAAAGTVTGIETKYARDTFANDYGNYVRIAVDTRSPNGELLDLTYCHMLSLSVTNGQRVGLGDLVGYSDNTGQSDSEHVHFMTEIRGVTNTCPFSAYPVVTLEAS
jgi:murein DD-endopeptidase MepM/ murein hydrolase activator NlpD